MLVSADCYLQCIMMALDTEIIFFFNLNGRHEFQFLPARRYASAGNSDRNVSVRPSVCPSRAGIVSKRRKVAAWFLHHPIAPRL